MLQREFRWVSLEILDCALPPSCIIIIPNMSTKGIYMHSLSYPLFSSALKLSNFTMPAVSRFSAAVMRFSPSSSSSSSSPPLSTLFSPFSFSWRTFFFFFATPRFSVSEVHCSLLEISTHHRPCLGQPFPRYPRLAPSALRDGPPFVHVSSSWIPLNFIKSQSTACR